MGDSNRKPTMLPWDIIDTIVAGIYHEGDVVTLRCCSLASPDLRGKCQALIFSKISLVSEEQTHRFASLLDHNTVLATYPRELKLGIPTSQDDPSYLNRLASTLFHLSNIQILRITSRNQTVYWNSIEGRLKLSIEHLIKSRHLSKLSLLFRCVRMALPALLYHSSNLRQLTISALDDLNMDTSSCQDAHRSVVPHLQYLEMKASQGMYKLLEAKGPDSHSILHCHSLAVLIVTLDGEDGLGCVERILPTFPGLEYLRFNGEPFHYQLPPTLITTNQYTDPCLSTGFLDASRLHRCKPYGPWRFPWIQLQMGSKTPYAGFARNSIRCLWTM